MYSIFKTFVLSVLMVAQVHCAYAQNAAILPPAKTTFVDQNGKPLTAGTVDFYIPGTTTRKTTWQDAAATVPNANPVVLDSAGRALILGNGAYRQVVKDRNSNIVWDQVTNSAGAGGGSSTTVGDGNAVGTVHPYSGFVAPSNYAFAYGQELSRTTYVTLLNAITLTQNITCVSGNATLTTISDTTQLNVGAAVEAACVPAGSIILSKTSNTVTISANATVSTTTPATFYPWGNGNGLTTFNVPDLRGVVLPGRNNMGGASSVNLSTTYYTDPNAIAGSGGSQSKTLLTSDLPSYTPSGTITNVTVTSTTSNVQVTATQNSANLAGGASDYPVANKQAITSTGTASFNGLSVNGGIAVSATVAAAGAGYSAGTQLLTISGGTCTTQPQFNVTVSAGAITAPVLVTAGQCSVVPSNPAATTGGGGTGGTLNVTYSAVPFSLIQPSKTINYVIKISPDVNLGTAGCGNLVDSGTACRYNVGTSGNTIPVLNAANSWSAAQTFASVVIAGGSFTGLSTPVNPTDATTKAYVDSVASGLNILAPTRLATAAVLPNTPTYANGASGVGATLTAGSNTTLTVDSTVANLNDVVLVKNQASAFQNGVYTVTAAGSGAAPWVLTRATYFDQAAEMKAGSYTFITGGVANLNTSYTLQTAVTTVGTDSLNWVLFSSGNAGNVVGSGSTTVGDIALFNNTTATTVVGAGYNPSQVPGLIPTTSTVTISNGANATVDWAGHGLAAQTPVFFCTTGALPTGLTACVPPASGATSANTYLSNPVLYYVCSGGTLLTNSFSVATTIANAKAGTCVTTSSAGSGTHTAFANAMACKGCIGEYVYSVVPIYNGFNLTTGSAGQVWNTMSLDAGIWELGGNTGIIANQVASTATVAAGGSGYSAGVQLLTVLGGTCVTQPQFNVTVSAGAITSPSLATAGNCSNPPSNPVSTSGGGGSGGTLNVNFTKTTTCTHMHSGLVYGFSTIPTSPFNGTVAQHVNCNDPNGWELTNNPEQVFLTTTTTINSVITSDFAAGPLAAYGKSWARRIK